jgi:hypothetical protein
VYTGRDGAFTLYEDTGTDYGYEKGAFATVRISYDESHGALTLGPRTGAFPGMVSKRTFNVRWISPLVRLDEYMKRQVAGGHIPGAVILLARHGKIVAPNSYGEADPDRHVPMSRDAIFRIYSQTKVVTGVAMMMLFEEGKWHFDDPVTRFLPELKSLRVSNGLNEDRDISSSAYRASRLPISCKAGFSGRCG